MFRSAKNVFFIIAIVFFTFLIAKTINFSPGSNIAGISTTSIQEDIKKLIPPGSYLREVKDVPGLNSTKIITYILNPKVDENFDINMIHTCPGGTEGQAIEGIYHLALYKNKSLYNDIVIPSYIADVANNKLENQKLAFKNTKSNAYYYFSGPKFDPSEVDQPFDVQLIQFGDFTDLKESSDFRITGPTLPCGHTWYLYGGYNSQSDSLSLYPLEDSGKKIYWGDNIKPSVGGFASTIWECGDHGSEKSEKYYYQFESTASAYMLQSSEIKKCY